MLQKYNFSENEKTIEKHQRSKAALEKAGFQNANDINMQKSKIKKRKIKQNNKNKTKTKQNKNSK